MLQEIEDGFVEELNKTAAANGITFRRFSDGSLEAAYEHRVIYLSDRIFFYAIDLVHPGAFLNYFDVVETTEDGNREVLDLRKPGYHTLRGRALRMWFPAQPEGWGDAQCYIDYLKPQANEIVLDIGAYAGLSALLFSDAVGPEGIVASFECDPDNFQALCVNTIGRKNITRLNKAVCGTSGAVPFSSEGAMGSRVIASQNLNRGNFIQVDAWTLPSIKDRLKLPKIDIVKLDIEGSEYGIFDAIGHFLHDQPARWMIEVHDNPEGGGKDIDRFLKDFRSAGYEASHLHHSGEPLPLIYAAPT